jgi:hypothetical protein
MKQEDILVLKAVALCYKPFLKPWEAMVYCNLKHSQLARRLEDFGIYKTPTGYYKREDLDLMMLGISLSLEEREDRLKSK